MSYLVDAKVLCEATRPRPNAGVMEWLEQHDEDLIVSVITLGEILKGVQLLSGGQKQRRLQTWFKEIEASFEDRILPVDRSVMREWAILYARHQKAGRRLSSFDSLLAATATAHQLTLATRNESDFPPETPLAIPGARELHVWVHIADKRHLTFGDEGSSLTEWSRLPWGVRIFSTPHNDTQEPGIFILYVAARIAIVLAL